MNHLIFDVETTGFFNPSISLTSKAQARVIQLAAIKLDNDLNEVESFCTLIKPESWFVMNEGAFKQHGISLGRASNEGILCREAMDKIVSMANDCENLVAHNIEFDSNMLQVELNNTYNVEYLQERNKYCTMNLMTPICKLPHKNGKKSMYGQKYKWPKLEEAFSYIQKHSLEFDKSCPMVVNYKPHDAMSDCATTAQIYKWLIKHNHITFLATDNLPPSLPLQKGEILDLTSN